MQTAAHYCSINLISPRRDALAFNLKRLSPFDRHSLCFRNKPVADSRAAAFQLGRTHCMQILAKRRSHARYSKFMHRAQKLNARRGHNTHQPHAPDSGGWFSMLRCCGADFLFIHHRRYKWFVELKWEEHCSRLFVREWVGFKGCKAQEASSIMNSACGGRVCRCLQNGQLIWKKVTRPKKTIWKVNKQLMFLWLFLSSILENSVFICFLKQDTISKIISRF